MKEFKKRLRDLFGVSCPVCQKRLPKANPSILLPGQTCRIHGYKDGRPALTDRQYEMAGAVFDAAQQEKGDDTHWPHSPPVLVHSNGAAEVSEPSRPVREHVSYAGHDEVY